LPFCLFEMPVFAFQQPFHACAGPRARFVHAFAREIETTAARAPGRDFTSISLVGGTPSS